MGHFFLLVKGIYQLRNDLKLYDPGKTESLFIEIICLK